MASPQKENGYTSIANELLEHIISSGLNGTELAIVLVILMKTYGFNKKQDQISISQFLTYIQVSKQSICSALEKLRSVKIITLLKKGNSVGSSNLWTINKDYDAWELVKKTRLVKKSELVKFSNTTSQVFYKQLVKKTRHTKDIITKDIIQKTLSDKVAVKTRSPLQILMGNVVNYYKDKTNSDGVFARYLKDVKELVDMAKRDFPEKDEVYWEKEIIGRIDVVAKHFKQSNLNWSLSTVIKKWKECLTYD